jgi:hypothetical protein
MRKVRMSKETISQEAMNQGQKYHALTDHAPKNQEIKLPDPTKPANLRANVMPIDGFVLSVDGKLKRRYETSKEAVTAGSKLKQDFPVVQVAVYDASERVYTPVALQEQES